MPLLLPGMVVPIKVLPMGQIDIFKNCLYSTELYAKTEKKTNYTHTKKKKKKKKKMWISIYKESNSLTSRHKITPDRLKYC